MGTAFRSAEQIKDFIAHRMNSASEVTMALASRTGIDECYNEGIQWLQQSRPSFSAASSSGIIRLATSLSTESQNLRVTSNEVTRFIAKATAATYPSGLEVTVEPGVRSTGVGPGVVAQTLEDAVSVGVKQTGLLSVIRDANYRRSICGVYGFGFHIESVPREVMLRGGVVKTYDRVMKAFAFHPLRMVLDPALTDRDLSRHEEVVYRDVYTVEQLRRSFPGLKFEESELKTVGELTPHEQNIAMVSGFRLFARFSRYANTKGARVFQVHCKDETGRFSKMYSVVEVGQDMKWVNEDNADSPFGGIGLPLFLLHGTRRTDSIWSLSDVSLMKDDQDQLNLAATWMNRNAMQYTSRQWIADMRWFGRNVSDEDARHRFTNQVGGIIQGNPPPGDRTVSAPVPITGQPPHPFLLDMGDRAKQRMMEKVHRTQESFGEGAKSHIPFQTTQLFAQNADQVLGIRVDEDKLVYGSACQVLLGTIIKSAKMGSPSTLQGLVQDGFDEQDLAVLVQSDENEPCRNITVSDASIRYRSADQKRQDLLGLSQQQAIDPVTLRKGLAELDFAVSDDDKMMRQEIEKKVMRLLRGEPWVPLPLGEYNGWCLSSLRRALFDRACKDNPAVMQAVMQAIQMQEQQELQAVQARAMAENPQPPEAPEDGEQEDAGGGEMPATMSELVDRLAAEGAA